MKPNLKERARIARRLRELRGDRSQEAFGVLIGVAQPQISQYEAGHAVPGVMILARIAQVTGADLNELAGLIETKEEGRG